MHTKAERVVEGKSSSSSSKREMALEALSSNEFLNFIIYDTISAAQYSICCNDNTTTTSPDSSTNFFFDINSLKTNQQQQHQQQQQQIAAPSSSSMTHCRGGKDVDENPALIHNKLHQHQQQMGMGRKKRRRRQRVCKNKEEAETQRMTHIAVERNRRKQMNEHLAVLRSLMPESYVQRGDQASIVGGAIEFVKELEHHLQSLEAQKFILLEQSKLGGGIMSEETTTGTTSSPSSHHLPFAQFFSYPQYTCSSSAQSQLANNNNNNKYMTSKSKAAVADIEVTLIETHANVRILSQRRLRQLSKLVTGFHTLYLSILHLNVTTLDPLVLYSISAKVEEGCLLNSADDIAAAVHHIIRIIEEEATTLCSQDSSL